MVRALLAVLDGLVGAGCCAISNQSLVPKWTMMPLCGAASGLSLYIEPEGRRLKLALYMFGQAVEMIGNAWVYNGLPAPSGLDVGVSASSIAFLTNAYQES